MITWANIERSTSNAELRRTEEKTGAIFRLGLPIRLTAHRRASALIRIFNHGLHGFDLDGNEPIPRIHEFGFIRISENERTLAVKRIGRLGPRNLSRSNPCNPWLNGPAVLSESQRFEVGRSALDVRSSSDGRRTASLTPAAFDSNVPLRAPQNPAGRDGDRDGFVLSRAPAHSAGCDRHSIKLERFSGSARRAPGI